MSLIVNPPYSESSAEYASTTLSHCASLSISVLSSYPAGTPLSLVESTGFSNWNVMSKLHGVISQSTSSSVCKFSLRLYSPICLHMKSDKLLQYSPPSPGTLSLASGQYSVHAISSAYPWCLPIFAVRNSNFPSGILMFRRDPSAVSESDPMQIFATSGTI